MDYYFYLTWFDKATEELVGEIPLRGISAIAVREAFGLRSDEYPGDCLPVTAAQVPWLCRLSGMEADLDKFSYFVEVASTGPDD